MTNISIPPLPIIRPPIKPKSQPTIKPKATIEPSPYQTIVLDDISAKLTNLLEDINLLNNTNKQILQEFVQTEDEGEYVRFSSDISGPVLSTNFTIVNVLNLLEAPHPVRGYTVRNDGPNIIFVAHNVVISTLSPPISDVLAGKDTRFNPVNPKEDLSFYFKVNIYKGKGIRNLYLLAAKDSSNYRGWLTW